MRERPIGSVRWVAVSATIPNTQVQCVSGSLEGEAWKILPAMNWECRHGALYRIAALVDPTRHQPDCPPIISPGQDLAAWLDVPPAGIKAFGGCCRAVLSLQLLLSALLWLPWWHRILLTASHA